MEKGSLRGILGVQAIARMNFEACGLKLHPGASGLHIILLMLRLLHDLSS